MRRRGKMIARSVLVLDQAFQRIHQPPPQRFAAKERPIVELGAIVEGEAGEKIAAIVRTRFLESTAVAGVLERVRIQLQFDRWRPSQAGAVGLENMLAERHLDTVKHAAQTRPRGLAGALGPQQRGDDVARHGAPRLRDIDQQRHAPAQIQLDRAVVGADFRKAERLKRKDSHEINPLPGGRPGDGPMIAGRISSSPLATERCGPLQSAPLRPEQ